MACFEKGEYYKMPLTLEKHLENLRDLDKTSMDGICSIYSLLKKSLEDKLLASRSVFENYSLHDASHSRSVIHSIERFLGETRIERLSPTDTFMLLICAYAHDYGMAQSYDKIYNILGSQKFDEFLNRSKEQLKFWEKEDAKAIENILSYINYNGKNLPLKDIYWSIVMAVQLFLRGDHWNGVVGLDKDFKGLFEYHLKGRFICGSEGISEICMCHGKDFQDIFKLSFKADGIVGDDFHPRFIAAMIRLGDLLDLDNNRFPLWFVKRVSTNKNFIPRLSVLHYHRHEAISHLLIQDNRISIRANCHSEMGGAETADLIAEWTGMLDKECKDLRFNWNEIAPDDFGRPPSAPEIEILVDGRAYSSVGKKLQMKMSQERVMKLLEGTSIYRNKYIGIREIIQNAIDASVLQLWQDITQNVYLNYEFSKNSVNQGIGLVEFVSNKRNTIFSYYDITVEIIKDEQQQQILLIVKDKGIGITLEDIEYIADIGSSSEKNMRIKKIKEKMPDWLKPSGVFGIGLQSVFQLTDCIKFFTRQPNQPEREITLYSYGRSKGNINVHDMAPNEDGMFYDNTVHGTNVQISIDPIKFIDSSASSSDNNQFIYCDVEFDSGDSLDLAYAELCQVCKAQIKSVKCDYFTIIYQEIKRDKNGQHIKGKKQYPRRSYFLPDIETKKKPELPFVSFGETIKPLLSVKNPDKPYCFIDNAAYFWDEKTCRCYFLKIRPCIIKNKQNKQQVFLPETVENLYHISYKFNSIVNIENIYPIRNRTRRLHAGFLEWNILILDGDPTKYLNIDRDCLKENAIAEEELLQILDSILQEWCKYFIELDDEKTRTNNSENNNKSSKMNRFEKMPGTLMSLVFLFYQNVSQESFGQFIGSYTDFFERNMFVVGKEGISLSDFWDAEKMFQTELSISQKISMPLPGSSYDELQEISLETLRHFPHRLVKIQSITNCGDGRLIYQLCFSPNRTHVPYSIRLDDGSRLYDYIMVFDHYDNNSQNIDFSKIQKKVFKPDEEYSKLIVPCYPHTFRKGRNFTKNLDHCIQGYILSPFDREAATELRKFIEDKTKDKNELLRKVEQSKQYQKCVDYILKKRFSGDFDIEKRKKEIEDQYSKFINNLCDRLKQYKTLLIKQFKEE